MTPSVETANTRPIAIRYDNRRIARIGRSGERGASRINPSRAFPYPSPMAKNTMTVKFTHSVWSGRNGMPPAMKRRLAPRNVAMNPKSCAIW